MNTERAAKLAEFSRRAREETMLFENASMSEKRVMIARDALWHLEAGSIQVKPMHWGDLYLDTGRTLLDHFVHDANACQACARGSLLYASMLRRNDLRGQSFCGANSIPEFDDEMSKALESLFEGFTITTSALANTGSRVWRMYVRCKQRFHHLVTGDTYDQCGHAAPLFRVLMESIIKQEGDFEVDTFIQTEVLDNLDEWEKEIPDWRAWMDAHPDNSEGLSWPPVYGQPSLRSMILNLEASMDQLRQLQKLGIEPPEEQVHGERVGE